MSASGCVCLLRPCLGACPFIPQTVHWWVLDSILSMPALFRLSCPSALSGSLCSQFFTFVSAPVAIILSDLSSRSCLYRRVSFARLLLCSLCHHYYCGWFRWHSLLFKKDWRNIDRLMSKECNFLEKQRLFGVA